MSVKDDYISRQSAIDAIDELFKKVVRPLNISAYEYDSAYAQGEIDAYVTAIDTLKTLAPAQPEQCEWIPKEVENVPYGLIVECSKCKHSELIDNALYHKYCPNCDRKVIREYE